MYRAALCEMPRAPRLVDGAATASDMDEDDDDAERSPAPLAQRLHARLGGDRAGCDDGCDAAEPAQPRLELEPRETPPKRRPPAQHNVVDLTDDLPEPEPEPQVAPVVAPVVAPEPATPTPTPRGATNWAKLTQVELRTLLRCFGLSAEGNKAALVDRLSTHTHTDSGGAGASPNKSPGTPERQDGSPMRAAETTATTAAARRKKEREQREAQEAEAAARRSRRPQIVSFDIETTIPRFSGDGCQ